ncbi:fork head domain-containing protein, partial [Fennellomyces sp. T-0311]
PPHSYASMIAQAILTSAEHKLTLRDIYDYVQKRYPHMYEANEPGWQNTIRHNLSLNRCFCKLPRANGTKSKGKGGYWCVDID